MNSDIVIVCCDDVLLSNRSYISSPLLPETTTRIMSPPTWMETTRTMEMMVVEEDLDIFPSSPCRGPPYPSTTWTTTMELEKEVGNNNENNKSSEETMDAIVIPFESSRKNLSNPCWSWRPRRVLRHWHPLHLRPVLDRRGYDHDVHSLGFFDS